MKGFLAIVRRDVKLARASGGDLMTLLLFFVLIGALMPFAVGPDKPLLSRVGPGIVWVAALLALLLGLDRLFRADREDGSLRAFHTADLTLETIVLAKLVAAWLTLILPLLVVTPIHALLFGLGFDILARLMTSLFIGTPGLLALGAFGAALSVSLKHGGLIGPVVILPLAVPILIFGIGAVAPPPAPGADRAALLLLGALSIVFCAGAPFVAALALRVSED